MEEKEDHLNPSNLPSKPRDTAQLKKHLEMLERLSNRHQARKSGLPDSSSLESTSSFLSRFAESKRSIESQLAESRLAPTSDPAKAKFRLADISSSISELEKFVAENSYFLPSYEVRSSLKTISELKQNLESVSSELVPKKKFSFKNKSAAKRPEPKEPEIEGSDVVFRSNLAIRDSPGFRNKENEVLVKNFRGTEIGEFTASDLNSCEVRLIGSVNALFIHRLRDCKVYAGPVFGSILIEDAEDCVFVLASHQIRIHCARRSDLYLRVRSRPIIEDCNGVRFAPYCLEYDGMEEDLKVAGLEEETSNWANVDDFRWLRAVQSPNWSVLPEEDRIANFRISELKSSNGDA